MLLASFSVSGHLATWSSKCTRMRNVFRFLNIYIYIFTTAFLSTCISFVSIFKRPKSSLSTDQTHEKKFWQMQNASFVYFLNSVDHVDMCIYAPIYWNVIFFSLFIFTGLPCCSCIIVIFFGFWNDEIHGRRLIKHWLYTVAVLCNFLYFTSVLIFCVWIACGAFRATIYISKDFSEIICL